MFSFNGALAVDNLKKKRYLLVKPQHHIRKPDQILENSKPFTLIGIISTGPCC
jgi:hypothetical protein